MPAPDDLPPWLQRFRAAVGVLVRHQRHQADLSQLQLAHLADLDVKTVSRIETGTHGTSIDQIARIAAALRVPADRLLPAVLHLPDDGLVPRWVGLHVPEDGGDR